MKSISHKVIYNTYKYWLFKIQYISAISFVWPHTISVLSVLISALLQTSYVLSPKNWSCPDHRH